MDGVREIMQACNSANIPVFVKNNILDYRSLKMLCHLSSGQAQAGRLGQYR